MSPASYTVEIYQPRSVTDVAVSITSPTPFMPIQVGSLIDPKGWPEAGLAETGNMLRVTNVEHDIRASTTGMIHRLMVYTREVEDRSKSRLEGGLDPDLKRLLGFLLGQTYRIQRRLDPSMCPVSDATTFGLLHGFENVIDEELEKIGQITNDDLDRVAQVLDEYYLDPEKLAGLKGFYDMEHKLLALGIGRLKAISIFTYYLAGRRFENVIRKLDSAHSPLECRTFEVKDHER